MDIRVIEKRVWDEDLEQFSGVRGATVDGPECDSQRIFCRVEAFTQDQDDRLDVPNVFHLTDG